MIEPKISDLLIEHQVHQDLPQSQPKQQDNPQQSQIIEIPLTDLDEQWRMERRARKKRKDVPKVRIVFQQEVNLTTYETNRNRNDQPPSRINRNGNMNRRGTMEKIGKYFGYLIVTSGLGAIIANSSN